MFTAPEKYRVKTGSFASYEHDGPNGHFVIPLSFRASAYVIASDGMDWEHVSVHIQERGKARTPTWAEMCKIKDLFWSPDAWVVQYHPAASEYVNNHPNTLHLWRPITNILSTPPSYLVGIVKEEE